MGEAHQFFCGVHIYINKMGVNRQGNERDREPVFGTAGCHNPVLQAPPIVVDDTNRWLMNTIIRDVSLRVSDRT